MQDELELFIQNHNLEPSQETARSYIFDCPVCGGHKKLYIQKDNGLSVCFKGKDISCPRPGSKPDYALSLISGLPLPEVKRELYEGSVKMVDTLALDMFSKKGKAAAEPLKPVGGAMLPSDVTPISVDFSAPGKMYLENRGVTVDMMKKYGIMYSNAMRRVIFPVIMNNELYGWQGRAIDPVDKSYRMYNLPGEWKAKSLMFYDNLKSSEFAVIAEGPVSALKFEKVGGFVATMGKMVSKTQLELIRDSGVKRIYMALDRDAAENTSQIRDYFQIKCDNPIECFLVEVPEHRDDFGDCTVDECVEAVANARRVANNELFVYIK